MKFWRNFIPGTGSTNTIERRDRRSGSCNRPESSSVPTRRRSSSLKGSNSSLSEDAFGITFVELIKRAGTHLGVIVTGGKDTGLKPRIADLVPGSWAQRSNVLCAGDIMLNLNGKECSNMMQHQIVEMLDTADKVQLEVKYRLPPLCPSSRTRPRVIQITLRKENGSFGFVVRGGAHEISARCRPFTVVFVDQCGPAQAEGTIRPGDRILALNGKSLVGVKLAELQSLMYQEEGETVFTLEYDVAKQSYLEQGAILVEISREQQDLLGVGLSRCPDTKAIIIESIKQASLADRCGALHVGDILLSVCGQPLTRMGVDDVTQWIRDNSGLVLQLEVLPGAHARSRGGSVRASLPSPCFSTMQRRHRSDLRSQEHHGLPRQMSHANIKSILDYQGNQQERERKKFVSFSVELDRTGGPLGITLATDEQKGEQSPIYISSMAEGGLARTTKAIQIRDELIEVNGVNVKGLKLSEAVPLLQNSGNVVKLKLTRMVSIPEREFHSKSFRLPPRPCPSPIYAPVNPCSSHLYSPIPSPTSNYSCRSKVSFKGKRELPVVTLLPQSRCRNSDSSSLPLEVTRVTLFKDQIYEDFGFSVSDGLYERGIFVNRIRKGGPADVSGMIKPFDRILQLNQTRTTEFDCCLAVPLIAAAGDKIEILLTRPFPDCEGGILKDEDRVSGVPWIDETDQESNTN
ncbi:glutamate receptor-interacting protein 2 isoform X2 [Eurytemora carolleeae]|uniref:glutamate receptor-interacting protein 2 isoform X2 n=1 Tax=Eurytemora carolleeae TaxID=1294199 RepID=UPI000C75D01F|nr:glutamate receptor-interacting protein 2 isoform X2 [Eurytemora carolleeae]|eukprot:XP_023346624.1 glutamate receptor-interacting protein 2-like isoform X2 [Eurytemora affinis]